MILGRILDGALRFQCRGIKEAIVRAAWRMSYFTYFVQQRAFVPPPPHAFFHSGDALMNAWWLMRCGWPAHFRRVEHSDRVLGRRRALAKQEAACRKRRLLHCVPEGFKPRLLSTGNFTVRIPWRVRAWRLFYCFFLETAVFFFPPALTSN